jgi:hypothetical protein
MVPNANEGGNEAEWRPILIEEGKETMLDAIKCLMASNDY